MELALDAALVVMRNGGSTVAAERTYANALRGLDTPPVPAVFRLDFLATASTPAPDAPTIIRPVGPIGVNLSRATAAVELAERAASRKVTASEFEAELERVKGLPPAYGRWVTMAAAACAAGFFSRTAGGDWGSLGIAFVAAGIGQALRSLLMARKVAMARVMLACGVLSAVIAAIGLRLGLSAAVPPTLISSVVYMVPGLPLINGFLDMASHKHVVVGAERMLNAAFLFLVLAVAIAVADTLVLQGAAAW